MLAVAVAALLSFAPQDLQLDHATVYTGTDAHWDGPVVVTGGRIQPPGSKAADGAVHVDLTGAFVYPGLQDAHGHLLGLGTAMSEVDLVGTRSYDEVIARVVAAAKDKPAHSWILGRGWDQNDWRDKSMPHHAELSAETPDHPVYLARVDGHAALLNQQALFTAGIVTQTQSPSGGEILHDEDGEPTGVLVDRAMALVNLPEPDMEEVQRRLLAAQERCLQLGLTCVHDAGVPARQVDDLRMLDKLHQWKLRTYVMLAADQTDAIRRGPWQSRNGLISVRAVKAYADGALGSRGAALLEPYSDRKGYKGLMTTPPAGLRQIAQLCADKGMQLCVHAIGDAANRAVLDAYAATKFTAGRAPARFRIEHCQVLAKDDIARFKELAVIPSMQPTHLTSDMPWAPARLGDDRIDGAYAFKTLLDLGLPVAFGSDFPVESPDPRKGLFAAVTTRSESGGPAAGYRPDQKLDRVTALRGFTANAAYAMFAEADLGSIAAGKLGDFTVYDRDLLHCSDDELLQAKVLLTVVGGVVVFDGRAGK